MTRLTLALYNQMRAHELIGRRARLARNVVSGLHILPRNLLVKIVGKRGGLDLQSEACTKCGFSIYARQVDPESIELLPVNDSNVVESGDLV